MKTCANCGHYLAYHDSGWRRLLPWLAATFCRAWDPDKRGSCCECPGWSE